MSAIQGFSTQKKLDTVLAPYTSGQTDDKSQFATLQENYSNKVAIDTTTVGYYKTNGGILTIAAIPAAYPLRQLNIVGHGASKGDMVRFASTSSLPGFEAKINHVIDADNIVIAAQLPSAPTPGDQVDILRAVTQRLGADGTIQVSIAPMPLIYVLDGIDTEVEESTTAPDNSRPLPVKQIGRFTESAIVDASSSPIDNTTGEILHTTTAYASEIEIINSTGYPLALDIDGSVVYISSNGLLRQPIAIVSGAILTIKTAQAATASDGIVAVNLFS